MRPRFWVCKGAGTAALLCMLTMGAFAAEAPSLSADLKTLERGEKLPLHIPNAKYRIATFPYEDPDGTELADALAAIMGREILLRASGISIGVLAYEGGLTPGEKDRLSYFDKVEKVATAQDVTLSIWGMVRRNGSTLRIDTYLQLPPKLIQQYLVWRVTLPRSMNGTLVARLRPDRVLLQSIELSGEAADVLRAAAKRLTQLHAQPSDDSAVVGELPKRTVYSIEKQSGDWVFMDAGAETKGWVRSAGYCTAQCAPILDAAGFSASLLAFMAGTGDGPSSGQLAPDAEVMRLQIANYRNIERSNSRYLSTDGAYLNPVSQALKDSAERDMVPAGGAALANCLAINRIIALLRKETLEQGAGGHEPQALVYNTLTPDRAAIGAIAFDLAQASLVDPNNADVLQNLAVLFAYAGDEKRAALARSLLQKMGVSMESSKSILDSGPGARP